MGSIQAMIQTAVQAIQQPVGISWATVVIAGIAALVGPISVMVTQLVANRHDRALRAQEHVAQEAADREQHDKEAKRVRDELYLDFVSSLSGVLLIPETAWGDPAVHQSESEWATRAHEALGVAAKVQIYGSNEAKLLARKAASQYAFLAYDMIMSEGKDAGGSMSVGKNELKEILPEFLELVQAENAPA